VLFIELSIQEVAMGQLLPFVSDIPVFVVDDDLSVREALALLLKIEGYAPQSFGDGASFLEAVRRTSPACVILDLHLPGDSGIDILRKLAAVRFDAPILVISGGADVATAVAAMKFGALDFLEKPFSSETIIDLVHAAVKVWREAHGGEIDGLANFSGRHLLTCREREVLSQVANGASNKEAGRRLGISPRTVEVHRARIMDKLGAKNAADLMRIVLSETSARPRVSVS
jgi:two-component system, LuxR family, response regulator FixJ